MTNVIVHIPHSGQKIGEDFFQKSVPTVMSENLKFTAASDSLKHVVESSGLMPVANKVQLLVRNKLMADADLLCDKDIERLLISDFPTAGSKVVYQNVVIEDGIEVFRALFSRICVDMERNPDEAREPLAKRGFGVVYERTYDGSMIMQYDEEYINSVLRNRYNPYHAELDTLIDEKAENGGCIIVNLHSYSALTAKCFSQVSCKGELPDICVGCDESAHGSAIVNNTLRFFEEHGYTVSENVPFVGSFCPPAALEKRGVTCISLFINKELYLKDDNTFADTVFVDDLRQDLLNYMRALRDGKICR